MADDNTIRWALVTIIALCLPFAFYFRFRSATSERLDRWQEGTFILFGLRLGGLPGFVGTIAWIINPNWMAWSSLPLPYWLRWLGIGLLACAGILVVWTFRNLGKNLTDTVVTRKDHTFITTGPYRYVRHPFYVAFAVGVLGGSIAMANWFLLLAGLVPIAFIVAHTRIEEEKLIDRFGDEYRNYMQRVGRFVPRFKL